MIPYDPDTGPTSRYCDNLRRLAKMFGEQSVIAHLPSAFDGRPMDWFNSNTMSTEEFVEGSISSLKREFVVNSAKATNAVIIPQLTNQSWTTSRAKSILSSWQNPRLSLPTFLIRSGCDCPQSFKSISTFALSDLVL